MSEEYKMSFVPNRHFAIVEKTKLTKLVTVVPLPGGSE